MGSTPNFATAKLQLFLYIPNILAKKNAFLAKKNYFFDDLVCFLYVYIVKKL